MDVWQPVVVSEPKPDRTFGERVLAERKPRRARRAHAVALCAPLAALLAVALPQVAPAADRRVAYVSADALEILRAPGAVRRDRGATRGRAVVLRSGGALRARLRAVAADRLVVRVRRGACPRVRMVVRADRRRVLSRWVGQTWSTLSSATKLGLGDHEISVGLARQANAPSCRQELWVDSVELLSTVRGAARRISLGTAVRLSALGGDPAYRTTLLERFDSLTPENEMKMNFLRPTLERFGFGQADQLVSFAERNQRTIRGHPLVWGQQLPVWLTGRKWPRADAIDVLRRHVAATVGRYRGRVAEWDVVNEPMADDGRLATTFWAQTIGPAYIQEALSAAHDADPKAKLFINETGAERPGPKADGLIALARDLRSRGVPLDGIGLQNHAHIERFPTREQLTAVMRRVADLGLEVQITEMDVATASSLAEAQRNALHVAAYREAAEACAEIAACTRLTVWGVSDRYSWIGAHERPTLFDDAFRPKPAYDAIRATLNR